MLVIKKAQEEQIGLRIYQYLSSRGIKQSFLVKETGLSANAISDICTGRRKSIDTLEYYKICKALGVDLMTFLTDGKDSEV